MNELEREILKVKKALVNKAKKKGIWEYFGQKEARKLMDTYGNGDFDRMQLIGDFEEWCNDFELDTVLIPIK